MGNNNLQRSGLPAEEEARRQFLARCGRFAIVTPPAMALLVTVAAKPDEAMASTVYGRDRNKDKDKDKHKHKHKDKDHWWF
jgi:hypothetical protein